MIFVSFGNVPLSFNRLAIAIDEYAFSANEKVIVQSGNTNYNFKNATATAFMNHGEFTRYLKEASVVVLQGGWGGISEASGLACRIVAVPRISGLEHNHDQFQLVQELEKSGVVIGVYEIQNLSAKIKEARSFNFQPIKKGSATEIINSRIKEWFDIAEN